MTEPIRPDSVEGPDTDQDRPGGMVTEPTKIIRIASMTRALLDEARSAGLDEGGRRKLTEIHDKSLAELREVLSDDLLDEFDEVFAPIRGDEIPSESVLRIVQAQLIGWLEGLFHGIQASLASQQMAAQAQLAQMQQRRLQRSSDQGGEEQTGLYL
ncbi:MAG: proteasome activator [Acidimicrobiia bacterium]|nr:proteasome activator [Acidimicrobiia bacterium]